MNNIKINIDQFKLQYDFSKRNYNIIIHSPNGTGKYDFIESLIQEYYILKNIVIPGEVMSSPDIHYIALPIYDKSGNKVRVLTNEERLMYEFGFENKFENNRVGTEITIDQVRDLKEFTFLSPHYEHKFIIINNCNYLNNQASAALLKTLEETNCPAIFILLTPDLGQIKDTIRSRCHSFSYEYDSGDNSNQLFFDYFFSKKIKIKDLVKDQNYLEGYEKVNDEIAGLIANKINPLSLSEAWSKRGAIFLDYLIEMFGLLMKGDFLDNSSRQKFTYIELLKKISISPERSIAIIRLLYNYKYEIRSNVNKKFLYDNLLIVLNKELY